jgi:hypothetical protein
MEAEPAASRLVIRASAQTGVGPEEPILIEMADDPRLDSRLRGQRLLERRRPAAAGLRPRPGDAILARAADGAPLWTVSSSDGPWREEALSGPEEMAAGESLRDQLHAGRFLGLLPLVHFLRRVTAALAWTPPGPRAAIVFDDPNLHAMSYGYLRFRQLVEHAAAHSYHVVLASIPLDYRFASRAAVRLFDQHRAQVSLALHGNNHEAFELLRVTSEEQALRLLAQSLRRAVGFEKRTGLEVSRVVCAPHEVCAAPVLRAALRLQVEAVCLETPLQRRPGIPRLDSPLTGWEPAQLVESGVPLLPRYPLRYSFDDVVLRAFLDQPLILFGHHHDVAGGLEGLEAVAARINRLGPVRWGSLSDLARSSYLRRVEGSTLRLRLYARLVWIEVPEGIDRIIVEVPPLDSEAPTGEILIGGRSAPVEAPPGEAVCACLPGPFEAVETVTWRPPSPLDPAAIPAPRRRAWPIIRRVMTEARDRGAPLLRR